MIYIIDANNLAGALGLLDRENFDRKLTELILRYLVDKKIDTYLVFDSQDYMGDKMNSGFLHVVYTPKDGFYKSADDKIIELVDLARNQSKDEITVITDDRGLIDAIKIKHGDRKKLEFLKASDFAEKLEYSYHRKRPDDSHDNSLGDDNKDIGKDDKEKINKELLKIWK